MSPDFISQTSGSIIEGALQEALLSISPESRQKLARGASRGRCFKPGKSLRKRSTTALLQDNTLDEGVSASGGSNSTGKASDRIHQGNSPPLIPRPPAKRRRRGYHLIEKMGLDKNKPEEHMKYKRIQVNAYINTWMCSSDLPTTSVRQKDVREQSQQILDQNKTFGNQPPGLVDELKRKVRRCCHTCYFKTADPC
jgi:hypothetical protein